MNKEFAVVTADINEAGKKKGQSSFIVSAPTPELAAAKAEKKLRGYTQRTTFVKEWTDVDQANWEKHCDQLQAYNANCWDEDQSYIPTREDFLNHPQFLAKYKDDI
jgi:hypothetical protein